MVLGMDESILNVKLPLCLLLISIHILSEYSMSHVGVLRLQDVGYAWTAGPPKIDSRFFHEKFPQNLKF